MEEKAKLPARREDTHARILAAAQQLFAEKGYTEAGLREIAKRAGVAGSLVIKYFSSKANLFEIALRTSLMDPQFFQADRSKFGETLISTLYSGNQGVIQPAMIALSIGDEEAKAIVSRVTEELVIEPMAQWLGGPDARARANHILMLTTGYLIFAHHIVMETSDASRQQTANLVAKGLQAIVDGKPLD